MKCVSCDKEVKTIKESTTHSFFIPGPLPGLNELLLAKSVMGIPGRKGARFSRYNKLKKHWEEIIAQEAHGIPYIALPVTIRFHWVEKGRRRDPDNIAAAKKLILDALVSCGVFQGDGWKHIAGFSDEFSVDKDKPGVWVELRIT